MTDTHPDTDIDSIDPEDVSPDDIPWSFQAIDDLGTDR